ncbi:hypothetical protein QFC21_000990 [Naganishia friedmannii]|uniref:Uncharacterized protein n=1 Tax=Naganishia friedmannii TaxID=89922 RepID=A0ACC2W7W1_9TREE|nr:hypothetical protein QFC21_000990 [Naganishia friedmannii]
MRTASATGGTLYQPPIGNLDPALVKNPRHHHGLPEQSPLALLAKTAEARSQGKPLISLSSTAYVVAVNDTHTHWHCSYVEDLTGDIFLSNPSNSSMTEQTQSTPLASKWSSRNRYTSKMDVDAQLDPVTMGMLSLQTAEKLFDLFWSKLANYAAFLDYRIHALHHVRRSSTLLTCVILHNAARHTSTQTVLDAARLSMALDKHINSVLWPRILIGNNKSVEICQACMVWATFLAEPKPGEDDLGWSLFGHATVEIGLNLSPPPAPVQQTHDPALMARNSERTWLTCFIADRSWATQLGRPPLIAEASLTINLQDWPNNTTVASFEDQSIVALIKLRRILPTPYGRITRPTKPPPTLKGCASSQPWKNGVLTGWESTRRWMSLRDNIQRTNEKVALEHAALDLPDDVYQYGHNNFFTMLSLPIAVLIQSQEARTAPGGISETFAFWITTILERLKRPISQTPHREGVNQWHASFFEKALERVSTPGTVADSDIMEMLTVTIPGDLMDMISWDWPTVASEWDNHEDM